MSSNEQPDRARLILALARARARLDRPDRFEQEELAFFERVRGAYLELAAGERARLRCIAAGDAPGVVAAAVAQELDALLGKSQ